MTDPAADSPAAGSVVDSPVAVGPVAVVDASAVVDAVSRIDAHAIRRRLAGGRLAAPALLPFEVSHALRGLRLGGMLSAEQSGLDLDTFDGLDIQLWPWSTLAPRAWELGHNLSTYDASYVALAEMLDAPLVTRDARLARAPGIRCRVEVF